MHCTMPYQSKKKKNRRQKLDQKRNWSALQLLRQGKNPLKIQTKHLIFPKAASLNHPSRTACSCRGSSRPGSRMYEVSKKRRASPGLSLLLPKNRARRKKRQCRWLKRLSATARCRHHSPRPLDSPSTGSLPLRKRFHQKSLPLKSSRRPPSRLKSPIRCR